MIRLLLSTHDMSGRSLGPFVTHGGYRLGSNLAAVADHAPGAHLLDAFSKGCDQERQALREVTEWLAQTGTAR